jgi:hypothetical protein
MPHVGTASPVRRFRNAIEERDMDNETKHEIWLLTLSTLATVPVMAGLGFAVVSGIVGF